MGTLRILVENGVGIIRLDAPRGNALGEELVKDLASALRTVGGEPSAKAILLASAHPKLFCPGLDLVALSEFDRVRLGDFMLKFSGLVTDFFAIRKPVVAAVNGAAVAGGCLLALTADWRVVKRGAMLGLNEVKVGVPLPWSAVMLLKSAVPTFAQTSVALLGRNFEGDAAVACGLASEVAEADVFEAKVTERLAEFAEKDGYAYGVTKGYLRGAAVASMRDREAGLLDEFLDGWFSQGTRERIQKAVAALKAKQPETPKS